MSIKNIKIEAGSAGDIVNITTWGNCGDHNSGDVSSWLELASIMPMIVCGICDNGSMSHSEPGSMWGTLARDLDAALVVSIGAAQIGVDFDESGEPTRFEWVMA